MAIVRVQTPRGERTRDTDTGRFVANSIKEFADKVVKGNKEATAQGVVQALQQNTGNSLVGMAAAAPTIGVAQPREDGTTPDNAWEAMIASVDSVYDKVGDGLLLVKDAILDTSKNIVDTIATTIGSLLGFEKEQARIDKEARTEIEKEKPDGGDDLDGKKKESLNPDLEELAKEGGMAGWIAAGALSIQALLNKVIFAPFKRWFGTGSKFAKLMAGLGPLGKMLGRFGPLGLLITGLSLIIKYSDELIKALSPVIDAIKVVIKELKPVFDVLLFIGDLIIKTGIGALGAALEISFGTLAAGITALMDTIESIVKIVKGIFTGDGELIKEGFEGIKTAWTEWFNNVISVVSNALTGLGNTLGEIFGIEDFNEKMKEKFVDVFSPIFASVEGIIKNITSIFSGEDVLKNLGELAFNLNDVIMWPINQAIILIGNMFGWDGTYNGEPFTVQQWASDKISEIWEKIKSFFSFDLPELPKFEMPSFGEIFNGMLGALLPEPDGGWFARQFYRLFPDLKEIASGAVSTTNLSKSYSQITEGSDTTIDKTVATNVKNMEGGQTITNSYNVVNNNSGNMQNNTSASTNTINATNLKKEKYENDPWGEEAA